LEGLGVRVLGAVGVPATAASAERATDVPATTTPEVRPPAPPDGPADAGETDGARSAEALLVLEHVRAAERPLTLTELVEAIGDTPPARVRRRVRELIDEGEVVRRGRGRPGDPYQYSP